MMSNLAFCTFVLFFSYHLVPILGNMTRNASSWEDLFLSLQCICRWILLFDQKRPSEDIYIYIYHIYIYHIYIYIIYIYMYLYNYLCILFFYFIYWFKTSHLRDIGQNPAVHSKLYSWIPNPPVALIL